ncbi:hypothetical protein AMELA_G00178540 [Ameiurus melas]|uniref:Uncharacterized protein n=1 Tax=Ameiurus melas TaxID=219545 RepID=A0A7J6ABT7_AMEME|nr:hypothetical protein AMELA_G00178540 [Ameiurus melas]
MFFINGEAIPSDEKPVKSLGRWYDGMRSKGHSLCGRCIKAISQGKQGEWMRWDRVEQHKIGWQDLCFLLHTGFESRILCVTSLKCPDSLLLL